MLYAGFLAEQASKSHTASTIIEKEGKRGMLPLTLYESCG